MLGNRNFFSWLWDNTVNPGIVTGKLAQNWDHGRNYVIMAAAIVVSCFVGFEVALAVEGAMEGTTVVVLADGTMVVTASSGAFAADLAAVAPIIGGAAGGAAGGFVSGMSLGEMQGQGLSRAFDDGLEGAEYGAIEGGITAGEGILNGKGGPLYLHPLSSDPGNDLLDLAVIGGRGVEGAVANTLENKSASSGFWSGVISGAGGLYTPGKGSTGWYLWNSAAKGILGGLGSMNKHGKGFMTGFWSAEATAGSTFVDYDLKTYDPSGAGFVNDALGVAARGMMGGAAARFGFKTFSSGLFTGAGSEFLQDVVPNLNNPEKPLSLNGAVNSGFNLLQPKVTKKGVTYPLNSISGGTWGRGASWAQLFSPQASGSSEN